jgi:hypothetical protein
VRFNCRKFIYNLTLVVASLVLSTCLLFSLLVAERNYQMAFLLCLILLPVGASFDETDSKS